MRGMTASTALMEISTRRNRLGSVLARVVRVASKVVCVELIAATAAQKMKKIERASTRHEQNIPAVGFHWS